MTIYKYYICRRANKEDYICQSANEDEDYICHSADEMKIIYAIVLMKTMMIMMMMMMMMIYAIELMMKKKKSHCQVANVFSMLMKIIKIMHITLKPDVWMKRKLGI